MKRSRFRVPRRFAVTLSGDTRRFPSRPGRDRLTPRDSTITLVVLAAALALIPLVLATLAFGHAFRTSERGRADARLAAAARLGLDRIAAASDSAAAAARGLAAERSVQEALARNDTAALQRLGTTQGPLTVTVSPLGTPFPSAPLARSVTVLSSGAAIGRVDATVNAVRLLAPLEASTHTRLAIAENGTVRSGPLRTIGARGAAGQPRETHAGGTGYRVLHEPITRRVALVVAVPDSAIGSSVAHRQLVTLAAAAFTLAALAVGAFLVVQRRRTAGSRGQRSPVALVGEVVAAAHDPRALLPVILETAVAAMDAAGGRVVWDGERIAAIGAPPAPGGERLVFSLDDAEGHGSGRRQIVLYPRRGGFTDADREVADALIAQGRIALENARLHSVVRRQAVTDELTDLANRRRFMEVLQQEVARATRFESALALALCDLDHFKQINDRYGHQIGDDVLRAAANVIRDRVRETDLPARIGGEEFGIILSGTDLVGACALAEQLRHDLSEQVEVASADWAVTASFGVAMLHPGESAELLIGAADRALYRAKAEGRNRVCSAEEKPSAAA